MVGGEWSSSMLLFRGEERKGQLLFLRGDRRMQRPVAEVGRHLD
jgi:hypothetical protein